MIAGSHTKFLWNGLRTYESKEILFTKNNHAEGLDNVLKDSSLLIHISEEYLGPRQISIMEILVENCYRLLALDIIWKFYKRFI